MTLTPWVRSAVDLVLERRKLARRVDVVDAVFGPDDGNPATTGAAWTPGGGEPVWNCTSPGRGHLFTGTDPEFCTVCGVDVDG